MSKEQRAEVDAIMRQPRPVPRSVEEMRAGYAATQTQMLVSDAILTSEATLGDRRVLVVEPTELERSGTVLFGGGRRRRERLPGTAGQR